MAAITVLEMMNALVAFLTINLLINEKYRMIERYYLVFMSYRTYFSNSEFKFKTKILTKNPINQVFSRQTIESKMSGVNLIK